MFNGDPKTLAKVAPHIVRAAVFDPQPAAAKLLGDLLKDMGAQHVTCASKTTRGLELINHVDPMLICVESTGPDFDGVAMIAQLRRSTLGARKVPVIVVTGEARVESIKAARDAGAHEFLRKPYTAKDLFRRVENVTLKPRLWVDAQMYVGPDRRRFNSGEFRGARKRHADAAPSAAEMLKAAANG